MNWMASSPFPLGVQPQRGQTCRRTSPTYWSPIPTPCWKWQISSRRSYFKTQILWAREKCRPSFGTSPGSRCTTPLTRCSCHREQFIFWYGTSVGISMPRPSAGCGSLGWTNAWSNPDRGVWARIWTTWQDGWASCTFYTNQSPSWVGRCSRQ